MNCMKCGREIADNQVFCPECLADMARHPIKPGTPIQLPTRPVQNVQKSASHRKKEITPEKKLRRQRRAIAIMSLLLMISIGLLAFTTALLWKAHIQNIPDETIGQNYSAIETDQP